MDIIQTVLKVVREETKIKIDDAYLEKINHWKDQYYPIYEGFIGYDTIREAIDRLDEEKDDCVTAMIVDPTTSESLGDIIRHYIMDDCWEALDTDVTNVDVMDCFLEYEH